MSDATPADLTPIEAYAIEMITDGAESVAEDDLNEDEKLSDTDHETACGLAFKVIRGIRANPRALLALADDAEQIDLTTPTTTP